MEKLHQTLKEELACGHGTGKIRSTSALSNMMTDMFWEALQDVISREVDSVQMDIWRKKKLENVYLLAWAGQVDVKIRENGKWQHKSVRLAIGLNNKGIKDLLGIWCCDTDCPDCWLQQLADLKKRGVEDILITSLDNPEGFAEAVKRVYPKTTSGKFLDNILLQARYFLKQADWKDRKTLGSFMKKIYEAPDFRIAQRMLEVFDARWSEKYPVITRFWRQHLTRLSSFYSIPASVRKAICNLHPIEQIDPVIRKLIPSGSKISGGEDLERLMYMSLMKGKENWSKPIRDWPSILVQFIRVFGEDRAKVKIW